METSERQLFRARFAWSCKWLLSDVYGGRRFIVKVVCPPEKCFYFLDNGGTVRNSQNIGANFVKGQGQ